MNAKRTRADATTASTATGTGLVGADKRQRVIRQHPQPEGYEAAAVMVPIEELHRWAANPRDNAATVRKLMRSIRKYGFGAPMLARVDTKELIAGDTRIQAAMQLRKRGVLGLDKLPVRYMTLEALEAEGLGIADNRIGEESEWNEEKRDAIVQRLDDADEDLAATGLDDDEIETALLGDDDDDAPGGDDDDAGESKLSGGLTYSVVVTCEGEDQQATILERLEAEGYKCKPVVG